MSCQVFILKEREHAEFLGLRFTGGYMACIILKRMHLTEIHNLFCFDVEDGYRNQTLTVTSKYKSQIPRGKSLKFRSFKHASGIKGIFFYERHGQIKILLLRVSACVYLARA